MWVGDKEESILKRVELGFAGPLQGEDLSHFKCVRPPGSRGLGLRSHHLCPLPLTVQVQVLHIQALSVAWLGMAPMNVTLRMCRRPFMKLGPSITRPDLVLLCDKNSHSLPGDARALLEEWPGRPQFSWQGSPLAVLCACTHCPLHPPPPAPAPLCFLGGTAFWVWLHSFLTNGL